jgi:hypothetical protein
MPQVVSLPRFTFLLGPEGCGKTTLARLLCVHNHRIAMASFDEPIREATLAMFFPDQLQTGIDLREEDTLRQPLPSCPISIGGFMHGFRKFLIKEISSFIRGDLAKRRSEFILGGRAPSFSHIVYDDTEDLSDVSPFSNGFGSEACLMILVERPGFPIRPEISRFSHLPVRRFIVSNPGGNPEAMLQQLQGRYDALDLRHPPQADDSPPEPATHAPEPRDL